MTRSKKHSPFTHNDLQNLRARFGVVKLPKFTPSREGMLAMTCSSGDCRIWLGVHDKDGRGILQIRGKKSGSKAYKAHENMPWCEQSQVSARRAMWYFSRGFMPPPPFVVMTLCGHRGCITPEHLTLTVPGWQEVIRYEGR